MRSNVALALLVVGVSSQYTWCPSGGVPYDALSRCFYFVQKPTIFTDAEQLCTNFGGHLISIINAFENSFITSNATFAFPNTPFWIGGRQTAQQGQFAWTDGTTWSYSNWDGGEPNLANNCVARNLPDNAWRTSDCNQLRPYVCSVPGQYSNGSSSSCTLGTCPGGWTLFSATSLPQDAYCYKAINVTRWDDAEWNCGSENAHLASIHGPIENAFVAYLAKDNRIITDSSYDQTHVGLTSPKPFNFRTWSDGTPYDYENWADNEPSLNSGDNGCLAIASDPITKYAQWGQWVITNCDKTARNAVCKKRPTF